MFMNIIGQYLLVKISFFSLTKRGTGVATRSFYQIYVYKYISFELNLKSHPSVQPKMMTFEFLIYYQIAAIIS